MFMVPLLSQFQGALLGATWGSKCNPKALSTDSQLLWDAIPEALLSFDGLESASDLDLENLGDLACTQLSQPHQILFRRLIHMSLHQPRSRDWHALLHVSPGINWTFFLDRFAHVPDSVIPLDLLISAAIYRLAIAEADFHLGFSSFAGISHPELFGLILGTLYGASYGLAGFPPHVLRGASGELQTQAQILLGQWAGSEHPQNIQDWAIAPKGTLRNQRIR